MTVDPIDFPNLNPDTVADFERDYQVVRTTPLGDSTLAYSLILPIGWLAESDLGAQHASIGDLARIGLFADSARRDSAVVQAYFIKMPFEVDLRDWVQYYAEHLQTKLTHCRRYETPSGTRVEAGGIWATSPGDQVVRLTAFADNGRIFLEASTVQRSRYGDVKNALAIAAGSFHLVHPSGPDVLEHLISIRGGNPTFEVAYPVSWSARILEPNVEHKSAADIYLASAANVMLGYVRVKAVDDATVSSANVDQLTSDAIEELAMAGVSLSSRFDSDDDPAVREIHGISHAFIAPAVLGDANVEIRFSVLERDVLFAVTAISVRPNDDALTWLRSKRAYAIALATAVGR